MCFERLLTALQAWGDVPKSILLPALSQPALRGMLLAVCQDTQKGSLHVRLETGTGRREI